MKRIMYSFWAMLSILLFSYDSFGVTFPEKAAMVIRFDHTVPISYDHSLQKVVRTSLNIKPDTFFDIVSIVPQTSSSTDNQSLKTWATENTSKIAEKIAAYGVNPDHIQVTYQPQQATSLNEVRIFVR